MVMKMDKHRDELYQKTRQIFYIDLSVFFIAITLSSGGYLAALFSHMGMPDEITGLVAAVPVAAAVFQLIGAMTIGLFKNKKFVLLLGSALHRFSLAFIFFVPLFGAPNLFYQILIVSIFALGNFAVMFVTPEYSTWLARVTPVDQRSRYFSAREQIGLLSVAVASLLASTILKKFTAMNAYKIAFAGIGVILLAGAIINLVSLTKATLPLGEEKKVKISRQDLVRPLKDKKYTKVVLLLILWQGVSQIWLPFSGIYLINEIGIDYALLGIVGMICSFEKAILVKLWGRLVSRTSWAKVLLFAMLFFAAGTLTFMMITSENASWLFIVHAIIINVAWSVLGIALLNIQYENADTEHLTNYIGLVGALGGLCAFLVAALGSVLYYSVNSMDVVLNGMQFLCAISLGLTVWMCLHLYLKFWKRQA